MDELEFEFAPPNTADAGESALETEEKRHINLIKIIDHFFYCQTPINFLKKRPFFLKRRSFIG